MIYLLAFLLLLALIYGPQWWVQRVLAKYNHQDEDNFPGTGGELARHLLDKYSLFDVKVEVTEGGDHYDPVNRAVRLTKDKYDSKTLTAITVSAHECGHALQHAAQEPLFQWRTRLAMASIWANRLGSFLLFAAPILVLVTKVPSSGVLTALGAFLVMGFSLVVQLVTLPVELDASFKKALPILEHGYLDENQKKPARKILKAAAWTYVAGAMAGLLNFWRWLAVLRR